MGCFSAWSRVCKTITRDDEAVWGHFTVTKKKLTPFPTPTPQPSPVRPLPPSCLCSCVCSGRLHSVWPLCPPPPLGITSRRGIHAAACVGTVFLFTAV